MQYAEHKLVCTKYEHVEFITFGQIFCLAYFINLKSAVIYHIKKAKAIKRIVIHTSI